jgi:hypothetical protein
LPFLTQTFVKVSSLYCGGRTRGGSAALTHRLGRGGRVVIGLLLPAVALAAAATASAFELGFLGEPPPSLAEQVTCTITWDGGDGTSDWGTAANWDAVPERVPGPADTVCIPDANTVEHSAGDDATITLLQSEGAVELTGGTLTLTGPGASELESLTQSEGAIDGAGPVVITQALDWTGGAMNGTGATNIQSSATATIGGALGFVRLGGQRLLVNSGAVTWNGPIAMARGDGGATRIDNGANGTFTAVGDSGIFQEGSGDTTPVVNNAAGGNFSKNMPPRRRLPDHEGRRADGVRRGARVLA